ncbi:MAG: hypothetical protein V1773_14000 [bacterium]
MKNLIYPILLSICFSFLLISCEENFSPKTEIVEKQFLYGIITADDQTNPQKQYVVLSEIYDVEGYDPSTSQINHNIKDAVVTIKVNNRSSILTPDSITTNDPNKPKQYIYSADMKINSYDSIMISAVLPSGRVLSSRTRVPKYVNLTFSYPFNHGLTTNLNQVIPVYSWTIYWTNPERLHLLFPKLQIQYYQKINGIEVFKTIEVPNKYITRNNKKEPYYITYTRGEEVSYDFEAIDYAMTNLSAGDSAKSNYRIVNLLFQLNEFDAPLSNYYSSTNGYLDAYSVRSDESVYNNVSGGGGVFGSKFINNYIKDLDGPYVKSFGYVTQ